MKPRLQSRVLIGFQVFWLLAAAGAVASTLSFSLIERYPRLLIVGAAFLVLNMLALRLPGGETVRIDVLAATAALGVLGPAEGVVAMTAGATVGRLLSPQSKGDSLLETTSSVARGVFCLGLAYACLSLLGVSEQGNGDVGLPFALLAAGLYMLFDLLTLGTEQLVSDKQGLLQSYQPLIGPISLLSGGQACLGVALVLVHPYMNEWSVLVLTLLGAVLLNGFNLYLRVRVAYQETIVALARASELGMPERTGHANSVAGIATLAARELGMHAKEVENLRYAALLHDIGIISAGESHRPRSEEEIGAAGAQILEDIPFLAPAAELIRAHSAVDLAEGGGEGTRGALGGALIRAASDFDMRMRAGGGRHGVQGVVSVVAEMRSAQDQMRSSEALDALEKVVLKIYAPS